MLVGLFTGDDGDTNKKRTDRNTDLSCIVDVLKKSSELNRMGEPNQIEFIIYEYGRTIT